MSRPRNYRRRPGRGVTLIELLLVLCIFAAVGAMAWPTLSRGLTTWRLKAAADAVRAALANARVEAMSTGRPWQFRYAPGDRRYEIAEEGVEPIDEAAATAGEEAPPATTKTKSRLLPEGISFAEPDVAAALPADELGAGLFSPSVRFLPDGSSSGGTVVVQNDRGRRIALTIRGLTGVAQVGDVEVGEGVTP